MHACIWYTYYIYMHTFYNICSPFSSFTFTGIAFSLCWMLVSLGVRSSLTLSVGLTPIVKPLVNPYCFGKYI